MKTETDLSGGRSRGLSFRLIALAAFLAAAVHATGCGNDTEGGTGSGGGGDGSTGGGFVAEIDDFLDYASWGAIDYTIGPVSPYLSGFHMGSDESFSRVIHSETDAPPAQSYPEGTIFVKETVTWNEGARQFASTGGLLAMVKRGGGFNP